MERHEGIIRPAEAHGFEAPPSQKGNKVKELDNKIKHLETQLKQEKSQLQSAKSEPEGRLKYPKMAVKKLTSCLYGTTKIEKKIKRTLTELDSARTEKKDIMLVSQFVEALNTGQQLKANECLRNIHDINIQDENGNSPFVYACQSGNFECLELILRNPELKIPQETLLQRGPNNNSPLFELMLNGKTRELVLINLSKLWEQDNVPELAMKEFGKLIDDIGLEWFIDSVKPALTSNDLAGSEMSNRIMNELTSLTVQTIANDLDANSTVQLRKFVNIETEMTDKEIFGVLTELRKSIDEKPRPLSSAWENLEFKLQRFEQLSEIHIEKEKMSAQELLKMASIIEDDLIEQVAGKVLPIRAGTPRKLLKTDEGSIVVFSSRKSQSDPLIKGQGAFKKVKSAARIPLDRLSRESELIVYARTKELTNESYAELKKEWDIISKFRGKPGFIQGYDVFTYESKTGDSKLGILFRAYNGDLEKFSSEVAPDKRVILDIDKQLSIGRQAVTAVDTMHGENIINRDLKLPNVLFRENENGDIEIALSDFGNAIDVNDAMKAVNDAKRTNIKRNIMKEACSPAYLAPEVTYEYMQENNPKGWMTCETWSLGIMLYNLLFEEEFTYPRIPSPPEFPDPADYRTKEDFIRAQYQYAEQSNAYYSNYDAIKLKHLNDYKAKHDQMVEGPLQTLLFVQENTPERLTRNDKYKIAIYQMLRLDPAQRKPLPEILQMLKNI